MGLIIIAFLIALTLAAVGYMQMWFKATENTKLANDNAKAIAELGGKLDDLYNRVKARSAH